MLFNNAVCRILREEEGAGEAFETKEVKDVAKELDKILDDIPASSDEDVVGNGEVPFKAEMCTLVESANVKGKRRWLLEMDLLYKFMESEGVDDPAEAVDQVADANSGETVETAEGDKETVEIKQADIVIVAPSEEEVKEIVSDAMQEAKLTGGKKGPAAKKLDSLTANLKDLKNKGIKVVQKKDTKKAKKSK